MTHLRESFLSDPKNRLALNLVSKSDPLEATVSRPAVESGAAHVFSHRVEEAKPMTNQKSSGRCWLFACLNAMRIPFMKSKNLDDFEFSQGHLFFCDKVISSYQISTAYSTFSSILMDVHGLQVERCNYFLHSVVEAARKEPKEKPDGRLFSFLLSNPTSDGGQWDMVVNLIKKYGGLKEGGSCNGNCSSKIKRKHNSSSNNCTVVRTRAAAATPNRKIKTPKTNSSNSNSTVTERAGGVAATAIVQ